MAHEMPSNMGDAEDAPDAEQANPPAGRHPDISAGLEYSRSQHKQTKTTAGKWDPFIDTERNSGAGLDDVR